MRRLHHLDALRGVLMMYGVIVHSATIGEHWLLDAFKLVSSYVRMEGFFILAGFFTAVQLRKLSAAEYLKARIPTLAVPLIITLLTTSLVTNYLIECYKGMCLSPAVYWEHLLSKNAEVFFIWHLHLWFLFSLIAYSLIGPLINSCVIKLRPHIDAAVRRGGSPLILIGMVVFVICCRGGYDVVIEPYVENTALEFVVRSTCSYIPYFILGVCAYHSTLVRCWFEQPNLSATFVAIALLMCYELALSTRLDGVSLGIAKYAINAVVAVVGTNWLWMLFERKLSNKNPSVEFVADASYTVYLLHYVIIASLANVVILPGGWLLTRFVAVVMLTFAATLAFHAYFVNRIPLVKFLLNGKMVAKSPCLKGQSA